MRNNKLGLDIYKIFGVQPVISAAASERLSLWEQLYTGEKFEDENGAVIKSLNLGAAISSELARLTVLELKTTFGRESEFMDMFLKNIRQIATYTCALGASLWVPYTDNDRIIHVNTVPATGIFPIRFSDDGQLLSVVCAYTITSGAKYHTLFEYRDFNAGTERVYYKAFVSQTPEFLGTETFIENNPVWSHSHLNDYEIHGLERPLFVYWHTPLSAAWEPTAKTGISCLDSSASLILDADMQYSRYLWEYEGGELALNVDAAALEQSNRRSFKVAKLDARLYRGLDIKDLFEAWQPPLRDESLYRGLNNILRQIEFRAGLSYGTLSDVNFKEMTATEIMASKQRSYSTVKEIQNSLEYALRHLSQSMCTILGIAQEEPIFVWDDSIIIDTEAEKDIFMKEIELGVRAKWEYRAHFFGETEEQAKEAILAIDGSGSDITTAASINNSNQEE